jgi:hypothetical protein
MICKIAQAFHSDVGSRLAAYRKILLAGAETPIAARDCNRGSDPAVP